MESQKYQLSNMKACDKPNCFMRFVTEYCQKVGTENATTPCPYEEMFNDSQYPLACVCECEQCKSYIESEERLVSLLKKKDCTSPCPCDLENIIRHQVEAIEQL